MSKGVNKVIIIGSLGSDPKVTVLKNGSTIANISIATDESYKDKSGQLVKQTEWHKVVFFNKLAEIADQYLKKGAQVYVEGSLRTRKYVNQDVEHYITEIVARNMQMLDKRSDGQSASASTASKPYTPPVQKAQEDRFSDKYAKSVFGEDDPAPPDIPF